MSQSKTSCGNQSALLTLAPCPQAVQLMAEFELNVSELYHPSICHTARFTEVGPLNVLLVLYY